VFTLKEVIRGCQNLEHKYQKAFYEKYYGFALKIIFRYIYRYERAIDVTNDGFVKVFKNIRSFDHKKDEELQKVLMGWMRRIMVNTAIDELRKNYMMPEIGALPDDIWEEPDLSREADQTVLYKELIMEIKKLPPSYRAVFNMYVIDGFSHQEIAQQLGISVGTSKSSLFKARMHLQKLIKGNSSQADICIV
jgi:RNA polymerase sigma factor (sigma-70 family)